VLYIYFNLITGMASSGLSGTRRAGVDGLLALDLPPEESENYETLMRQAVCATSTSSPRPRRRTGSR